MGDRKAPLSPSYSSSPLFLHHDQHGHVLAACFPPRPDRSSTKTKQRKKTKCTRADVSPAARSVHCVGGPPLSAHRMQCISGRAAGGGLRQTGRKDQPQRSTHSHFQSVYSATMDSSTVISSGFPPAGQDNRV